MLRSLTFVAVLAPAITLAGPAAGAGAAPQPDIDIQRSQTHQTIDGFGYSTAFQRATLVHNLPADKQKEVLDLLLDRRKGAAPSILRLGIGSSATNVYDSMLSIQPADPGGPDAPPKYTWDGWDSGQVWFSKEAQRRGVKRFYADAWSAPGYMKTNGTDVNGGNLCGLQGTTCASGDWRAAYARYLVQYAKFYQQEGIKVSDIAFLNEPDWTTEYASMRFTPAQAAEFVKVFGPYADQAGLNVVCCESIGWKSSEAYAQAIENDPEARKHLDIMSGHGYASGADFPLPTSKPTWMSEWAPSSVSDGWNEAWDSGKVTDGINIAERIHNTLALSGSTGFVYWLGGSRGKTAALIQIDDANGGYRVSSRLYAFAAYSRFIRPDAVRLGVNSIGDGLKVSAYRNTDGTEVVEILNTSRESVTTTVDLKRPAAYLTDSTHNLERDQALVSKRGPHTSVTLAPRSLTTLVSSHPQHD
ncbi:glycoside hydrolase [Nonomuraea angiospora]|uniref:glycoside hydrolase family 30 protein n=1 Tax=Nonomuraea angiospora TaxID=46172 RepID=UPI00344D5CF7